MDPPKASSNDPSTWDTYGAANTVAELCGHDGGVGFVDNFGDLNCADEDFEKELKQAGLPHIRFHDLRHSAATLLMAQGVPIKMISELLGHSTIRMALDLYSHVLDPIRQDAADRMDDLLGDVG